jgi:seryl-tRNA synthetase
LQVRTQELQNLRNTRSKAIGQAKAKGEDVAALMAEVAASARSSRRPSIDWKRIRAQIEAIALGIPNLPHDPCRRRDETHNASSIAGARRAPSISR